MNWQARAACAGEWATMTGPDVDDGLDTAVALLESVGLELAGDRHREERARAICRACPVLDECTRWVRGTDGDPVPVAGVAAGLTERERRLRWGHPTEADWRSIDRLDRLPLVLDRTREGRTVEQIAGELDVDPRTVKRARAALRGAGLLELAVREPSTLNAVRERRLVAERREVERATAS